MTRLILFALPATLVVALSALFLLIDTYFVAGLGADVLLGVSIVFPLYLMLVMLFGGGLGVGMSIVTSVRLGRGDEDGARKAAGSTVCLAVVASVVLAGAALVASPTLFARLTSSEAAAQNAWRFGWPIFAALPLMATSLTITNLLRSEKRLGAAAAMMLVGGLINTACNPVLIHGLGAIPALGVTGAGASTVAGFAASSLIGLWLLRGQRRLALRRRHLRLSWTELKEVISIALPTLLTYVANTTVMLALVALFASQSTDSGVAYGLATRLEYVLILTLYGLGGALMTLAGEARGAGRQQEMRRLFRLAGVAAVVGTLPAVILLWIWPDTWFRIFGASPSVVEVGVKYVRCAAWTYPLYALGLTLNYAYQTLGRADVGLRLTLLRGWCIAVPGAWLAIHWLGSWEAVAWIISASFGLQGLAAWWALDRTIHRMASNTSQAALATSAPPSEDSDLAALKLPSWRVSPYPPGYTLVWPYYLRFPSMRNHTGIERMPVQARLSTVEQPTVRICAMGDIMVMQGDRVPEFSPELAALLSSADQIIGCCEATLGRRSRDPAKKYSFMFDMPEEYLKGVIDRSGVPPERWALTLANNHAGDVGLYGPPFTFRRLSNLGVTPLGYRPRDSKHPVQLIERKGLRLGVAGWTRWLNVDLFSSDHDRVWQSADINALPWQQLRQELRIDALIGSAHWEYEWQHFPRQETRTTARRLHEAGFDLIVGSHPHVLQPFEQHGRGLSLYSLGNFCSGLGRAWPARMATVAEIELGTVGADRGKVVAYKLHFFAQVNGTERIDLLPLERLPPALSERIRQRVPELFKVDGALGG